VKRTLSNSWALQVCGATQGDAMEKGEKEDAFAKALPTHA